MTAEHESQNNAFCSRVIRPFVSSLQHLQLLILAKKVPQVFTSLLTGMQNGSQELSTLRLSLQVGETLLDM